MTPMPPAHLLAAAATLAALLSVTSCGLPSDGEAHVIESAQLPLPVATAPPAPSVTAPADPPTPRNNLSIPASLYFVRDGGVEPVTAIVRSDTANSEVVAGELLAQLKIGPGSAPGERGMTSRLAGDRRVQLLYILDAVATVELGPPPDTASQTRDGLWTAQIVMTLCSLEGIKAVRFTGADGIDVQVVLPGGKLVTGDITPLQVSPAVGRAAPTPTRTGGVRGTAKAAPTKPVATARPTKATTT